MTTGSSRVVGRARCGAAAALLVAAALLAGGAGRAWAQPGPDDGGGDLPPPEVLNKMCPEWAAAAGRQRTQIELLFFRLKVERAGDPKQAEAVKAAFDADKPEDVEVLKRYLLQEKKVRCMNGVQLALGALGVRGASLAVQWYATDAPESRGRVLEACRFVDVQEIHGLLAVALADKRPVPCWAEKEAPPGYQAKRVCDFAYKTLVARLGAAGGTVNLPDDYSGTAVGPFVKEAARDAKIAGLEEWLKGPAGLGAKDWVKGQPSLLADLKGAEKDTVEKILKDLGVK